MKSENESHKAGATETGFSSRSGAFFFAGRGKAGPACSLFKNTGPHLSAPRGSDCRNSRAGSSLAALTTRMHPFCQKGQAAVRNSGHYGFQKNSFEQGEAACHSWGLSACTRVVSNQAGLRTLPPHLYFNRPSLCFPRKPGTVAFFLSLPP